MKPILPLLLLLLTQLTACITTQTLESAEANGKILRYETRYYHLLEVSEQTSSAKLCLIVQPEPPAKEQDRSAVIASVDFTQQAQTIKLKNEHLQSEAECARQSALNHRKMSLMSPHQAGQLTHRGLAGRGVYATLPVLVAQQQNDYAAALQPLRVYRNEKGTITDSVELVIDTSELQRPVSRAKQIAAYAVTPLAVIADIITSPLQAIYALGVIESLRSR